MTPSQLEFFTKHGLQAVGVVYDLGLDCFYLLSPDAKARLMLPPSLLPSIQAFLKAIPRA